MEIADGKHKRKLRRGQPELTRAATPDGSFFYVLRGTRRSDPKTLAYLAGRCAPVVLTTLPIPPDAPVRLFVPRMFPLRRAAAALCGILPLTGLPPGGLAVGAFDPDGALCGRTDALLPLAADVRIVTRSPQRFAEDAAFARRRFGASLTVGENAALLADCDAVVCTAPDAAFADVPVVLSCAGANGAFSLLPVRLPEAYARLCPETVTPDLFAAALAERCGVRAPELYACDGVGFGEERLDHAQTAAHWRARIENDRKIFP